MKQTKPAKEIIDTHRPKKIAKYKFIIKEPAFFEELSNDPSFDMESLDTLHMDDVIRYGLETEMKTFGRETIGKANIPTAIDEERGLYISKSLITKADKKLYDIKTTVFKFNDNCYVLIKFEYEKFDIVELFLTFE